MYASVVMTGCRLRWDDSPWQTFRSWIVRTPQAKTLNQDPPRVRGAPALYSTEHLQNPRRVHFERRSDCPACGSRRLARSRRRNLGERFAGILVLPYRCMDCDLRIFQFRSERAATRWQRLVSVALGVVGAAGALTLTAWAWRPGSSMPGLVAMVLGVVCVAFDLAIFSLWRAARRTKRTD